MMTRRQMLLLLLTAFSLSAVPCAADSGKGGGGDGDGHGGGDGHDDDNDHDDDDDKGDDDKARAAVKNGNAASLQLILKAVRKKYAGQVVRIRLTGSGDRLIYRIRMLNAQNKLVEIRVNAVTRQILGAPGI